MQRTTLEDMVCNCCRETKWRCPGIKLFPGWPNGHRKIRYCNSNAQVWSTLYLNVDAIGCQLYMEINIYIYAVDTKGVN